VFNFGNRLRIIQAETGTGKSTILTAQLQKEYGSLPLLSIQPRMQNATGLYSYMKSLGYDVGCVTGTIKHPSSMLDYATTGCGQFLIEQRQYGIVVFDEIQDATPETAYMIYRALLLEHMVIIMSATIPQWVLSFDVEIEELTNKPKKFFTQTYFNTSFDQFLAGSKNIKRRDMLENVLQRGNAVIFLNGDIDLNDFMLDYGQDLDYAIEDGDATKSIIFRGTKDSAKMIKDIKYGLFPNKGRLIITNISLGTGVTIPNLLAIWDKGKILRGHSELGKTKYHHDLWFDGITYSEMHQRQSRGGRVCNTKYYCALPYAKLRQDKTYPFQNSEKEIAEIAAYLEPTRRIQYFNFLRFCNLITPDNDIDLRLDDITNSEAVHRFFDGFDMYTNIKATTWEHTMLFTRIVSKMIEESRHKLSSKQIKAILKGDEETIDALQPEYCPVHNRIISLAVQANELLASFEERLEHTIDLHLEHELVTAC
jgi:hypothetical protein